jgi:tRNA (guanosine-2'-O-)-methyltransferase
LIPIDYLLEELKKHLPPERKKRIEEVAAQRTRKLSLVLEDIRQEHNIGALLRTADILGVQDVHLVSQKYEAKLAKAIAKGSDKWISLKRYQSRESNNFELCLQALKADGYDLVVADPEGETELTDLRYSGKPLAVLMGSEWEGVSEAASAAAQHRVRIPQFGFTESFNVSVAAALILQQLSNDLRRSSYPWQLSEMERMEIELDWTMKRLGNSAWPLRDKIEQEWREAQ